MIFNKPILVTGSHRSGSTWVGKVIASAPSVFYVHEPFKLRAALKGPVKYWFQYVTKGYPEEQVFKKYIEDQIGITATSLFTQAKTIHKKIDLLDFLALNRDKLIKRPLIKDPLALFSAQWLADEFNMDVLVLIRHPAAFVASIKVKNWTHPFSHFTQQEHMLNGILNKYKHDIIEYTETEHDIIDQGILLWNIIHCHILKLKAANEKWLFKRHEDISRRPMEEFKLILDRFKLKFTSIVEHYIASTSSPYFEGDQHELKRNSLNNITLWKERLTQQEIERIKKGTEEISSEFYEEIDW